MLLINARVGVSAIHGLGLFACEFIPAGTVIWRYMPGFDVVIPASSLASLSISARKQVIHYAEYFPEEKQFVLSSDDDRFTNHSDAPNTAPNDDTMVATRDIQLGEEITCDYRQVLMVGWHP